MCTTDTLVHPIDDEDNAIALIRFESGAIGQFEVSWTFRGGMDLRDEVAGHRTARSGSTTSCARATRCSPPAAASGYVAEKAETAAGWLFPVGDEVSELGYVDMFTDMFDALDGGGDAAARRSTTATSSTRSWTPATGRRRSRAWEPVELFEWRGGDDAADHRSARDVRGPGR